MAYSDQDVLYGCAGGVMLRAARHAGLALPPWPDLTDDSPAGIERWIAWLDSVWSIGPVAEAIEHASPALTCQVEKLCGSPGGASPRLARRTVLSVMRYVLRLTERPTPFGLFAGIAPAAFGSETRISWGSSHREFASADAAWLSGLIAALEAQPTLLMRLRLTVNNRAFVRGERLVVPYSPGHHQGESAPAEVSVRFTSAVRFVLETVRRPMRGEVLADKLAACFPGVPRSTVNELVCSLTKHGVLLSSLHAPATTVDALGHLAEQLEATGASEQGLSAVTVSLRRTVNAMAEHNRTADPSDRRMQRASLREQMTLSSSVERPLCVDSRLDGTMVLPAAVRREAEIATSLLTRLTPYPLGTPAWQAYHNRFFARYGIGSLVPVTDLVDPDVGLGYPAGFLGAEPEPAEAMTRRDRTLLVLAQQAALAGRDEVELTDDLVEDLEVVKPDRSRLPHHLELRFRLHAASPEALDRGEFRLAGPAPSRSAGTLTGRFLPLLDPGEQKDALAVFEHMAADVEGPLPVQVSFTPLNRCDSHVVRAPKVLQHIISVSELRAPDDGLIPLEDLAVGCDAQGQYLASVSLGRRLAPVSLNALEARAHTPPFVRFLMEVARATSAVVLPFTWGAAECLPFLPRLRYARIILSAARWRLRRTELPGPQAPWSEWRDALRLWRLQRRLPGLVALTDGDQLLPIDLDQTAHMQLLRAHLAGRRTVVLTEAPDGGNGWLDGRAHELVVPLAAHRAEPAPVVAPRRRPTVLLRDHGQLPGASPWLLVKLYATAERHHEILSRHLTDLTGQWDTPPLWWFTRGQDPRSHLRLRIALPDPGDFAAATHRVNAWAACLRLAGLIGDMQYATSYPETGRWGGGDAMRAAEQVFAADSQALAAQFAQRHTPSRQALAAANFASIATAFTGEPHQGITWLIEHCRVPASEPLDRAARAEAIRLGDPYGNWAAVRAEPGGADLHLAWKRRDQALARYRSLLPSTETDAVLTSLLHAHHLRAAGIHQDDEHTCLRLARAAAQAWTARRR